MQKLSQIILYFTAIMVLGWFLPWLYALAFPAPSGEPFCSFSPVNNKWVVSKSIPGEQPVIMLLDNTTADGIGPTATSLTKNERDSLVPQLFYKELLAHDRLPDSIAGKPVSAHELRTHELMLNSSPRDIVKRRPRVWMMMESMPERVELTDADHVFRFTADGCIEFITMATNKVNASRSARFTETMRKRGFSFPARDLSANVTSRKPYDEGYLMIDNDGKLFHIKQQAGRPYVAAISMPGKTKASKAFLLEETDRSILGLVTDTDNNPYIIERDSYKVVPLPIGKINPRKESVLLMGNLFNLTFRISADGTSRWRAVSRDGYSLLGEYNYTAPTTASTTIARYIFPYTLSFVSKNDSLAYPRFGNFSAKALLLNALLASVLLIVSRRRKSMPLYCGSLITLGCGIFAFIPSMIFRN